VSSSGDTYQLAIPADPGVALPGPYMLFAMNAQGTPSISAAMMVSAPASTTTPPTTTPPTTTPPTTPPTTTPPTAPNAYEQAVINSRPSIFWPLNDASGVVAHDASGNGVTGTYEYGVTLSASSPVEGPAGKGITLNGRTNQVGASKSFTDPTSYTEALWFETTTKSGGFLLDFGDSPTGLCTIHDRQVWMTDAGQLYFGTSPANAVTSVLHSSTAYNDGKWHEVVATQGPDGMRLYVDGKLIGSNTTTAAGDTTGYWRVGAENLDGWVSPPAGNNFGGTVSDFSVYNTTELTAAQIASLYAASPAS
jgi:Concanavalin A-like lectin/glucanases superfamily/Domain of unknown function (DUF1929)